VTGLILIGFIFVHMLGNLQLYLGPDRLNAYSHLLHSIPSLLWATRLILITCVVLHMLSALLLWLQQRASRPQRYAVQRYQETTYAARTMIWGGPIIGLFVIYHLLHLTTGHVHGDFSTVDVYANVVAGFKVPWIAAIYIAANLALGYHLYHGTWSFLQTLGVNHPRYNAWRRYAAIALALAVTTANVSYPVSVLAGVVK
jgi:succinate dehydrogenase / fumarate reductase cytochrome b subunit